MNEFNIGGFAISAAGHDFGKCYVIIQMDSEYVYLVDGRIKTLNCPKRKKYKHVTMLKTDRVLEASVKNGNVKDEEIKRSIKLLLSGNLNKEAK